MRCSGCFRLERLPGGTCTHWKTPPFHGARQEPPPALARLIKEEGEDIRTDVRSNPRASSAALPSARALGVTSHKSFRRNANNKRRRA